MRRKRTSKSLPAKGRLRDIADKLWSVAIRDDWGNCCAACRSRQCEAHHLIPRQHEATRYHMRNGICLCARHHQFDPDISPHQNAAGFLLWLSEHYPDTHLWYTGRMECGVPVFQGTRSAQYYCEVISELKAFVLDDTYSAIVGVRLRAHLEGNPSETPFTHSLTEDTHD